MTFFSRLRHPLRNQPATARRHARATVARTVESLESRSLLSGLTVSTEQVPPPLIFPKLNAVTLANVTSSVTSAPVASSLVAWSPGLTSLRTALSAAFDRAVAVAGPSSATFSTPSTSLSVASMSPPIMLPAAPTLVASQPTSWTRPATTPTPVAIVPGPTSVSSRLGALTAGATDTWRTVAAAGADSTGLVPFQYGRTRGVDSTITLQGTTSIAPNLSAIGGLKGLLFQEYTNYRNDQGDGIGLQPSNGAANGMNMGYGGGPGRPDGPDGIGQMHIPLYLAEAADAWFGRVGRDSAAPPPGWASQFTLGLAGSLGLLDMSTGSGSSPFVDTQATKPSWVEGNQEDFVVLGFEMFRHSESKASRTDPSDGDSAASTSQGSDSSTRLVPRSRPNATAADDYDGPLDESGFADEENAKPQSDISALVLAALDSLLGNSPETPTPSAGEVRLVAELVPLDESSLALVASLLTVPREPQGDANGLAEPAVEPSVDAGGGSPPECSSFIMGIDEGFEQTRMLTQSWEGPSASLDNAVGMGLALAGSLQSASQPLPASLARELDRAPAEAGPHAANLPSPADEELPPDDRARRPETSHSFAAGLVLAVGLLNRRLRPPLRRRRSDPQVVADRHDA